MRWVLAGFRALFGFFLLSSREAKTFLLVVGGLVSFLGFLSNVLILFKRLFIDRFLCDIFFPWILLAGSFVLFTNVRGRGCV